jgi:hypothetical protein
MTDIKGPDKDECTAPAEVQPFPVRWSDEMAGCLCYYSTWHSPAISFCDCRDDMSDSESMVTIYSKSREVSQSPIHRSTPTDAKPPTMPSKILNAWNCWWCTCCYHAVGRHAI